ncbi:MAG: hypothetical protein RJQ14_26060, partial [Marinoscillum sp.]
MNGRIYLSGVDGSTVATLVLSLIGLGILSSFIFFGGIEFAIIITPVFLFVLNQFLKRYKRTYRDTKLDDPLKRDLEISKQTKVYRDDSGFLK